jgi:type IV pilus assembly protein PilZ
MRTILVSYGTNEEFISAYLSEFETGGLFIPTEEVFSLDEPVEVRLVLPTIPEGIQVGARIKWIRPRPRWRSVLLAGLGVQFAQGDQDKVEFLLAHCSGMIPTGRKTEKRVPVDMKVVVLRAGRRTAGRTRDISRGGISLTTDDPFVVGDTIEFELFVTEDMPPERFSGHVMWCQPSGGIYSVGVKFDFPSPFRQKRVQFLVNRISGESRPPQSPWA